MANIFSNRIVGYVVKPASELTANPANWRKHPAKQRAAVQASLRELGWIAAVIENVRTGLLVDGHERVMQALAKDESVPVLQVDLSPEEEALALATFDPITYLAETDAAALDALLRQVNTGDAALQALLADIAGGVGLDYGKAATVEDVEPQVDRAEELRQKWNVETGQLWQLGDHRLICGDCTDVAVVGRVMGGEKAGLLFTDPPYGIKRDKGFGGAGGFAGNGAPIPRRQYSDEWDSDRPSQNALAQLITFSEAAILFGGNFFADILPRSTHWIVWDKQNTMPTFGDCELAWTNLDRHSVKKYSIVYNGLIGKEKERYHPTQKPVALMAEIIKDYTIDNAVILDPYLGSGTTIIACEQLGRRCRAVEISPGYVAVALERWAMVTGKTPVLIEPTGDA